MVICRTVAIAAMAFLRSTICIRMFLGMVPVYVVPHMRTKSRPWKVRSTFYPHAEGPAGRNVESGQSEGSSCKQIEKATRGRALGILAISPRPVRDLPLAPSGFVLGEVRRRVQRRRLELAVVAMALILATYVGRALRWEIMLRPLTKESSLWGLVVGHLHRVYGRSAVWPRGRAGSSLSDRPERGCIVLEPSGRLGGGADSGLLMVLLIFGIALTQISRSGIQPGPHIQSALQAAGGWQESPARLCLALLLGLRHSGEGSGPG